MTALPTGWVTCRLDEIADVRLGRQRSPKDHVGSDMRPYLRAANVGWAGLILDDVKEMNFTAREMGVYQLEPGDILLSEASGSPDEVGKPALWSGQLQGCAFQNTLLRVRSQGARSKYVYYFLRHLALSGAFAKRSRGVGIHHIGRAALASWAVPLPPDEEQGRIVEILEDHLSRLDAADANLSAIGTRASSLGNLYLSQALTALASPVRPLAQLLSQPLANGRSVPTADHGFPVLRLTALQEGRIDLTARKTGAWTATEAAPFLVRHGDFLISRGNGSRRLVGRGGLVGTEPDAVAFPDTLIRIRVKHEMIHSEYLALVWNGSDIRRQIEASAKTTAGIYKINQTDVERVILPVPTMAEQLRLASDFATFRDSVQRLGGARTAAVARSHALRKALLAAAFAGQLQ